LKAIKNITGSQLFQVSSLNAISVLVRAAGGLLASKVTAVFIGPGGMALTENLRNFLTSLETFSTLGLQNGIIKYVAENEKEEDKLYRILSTAFLSILAVIIMISIVLFLFAEYWSDLIITKEEDFSWAFRLLALSLPWYIGNVMFTSVLNGLGRFRQIMYINIWGNIIGVLVSALLIWKMQLDGAFIALILYPAGLFIFTFLLIKKSFKINMLFKKDYFDSSIVRQLFSFSLMSLVTAVLSPLVVLSVRNMLISIAGKNEAGYWVGLGRISFFYFMFATTLLTVYYLPKLSVAKTNAETRAIFLSYYKMILPLFALGFTVLYFIKGFVIRLLFTSEFLPMDNLFFYQLLGDFFKVGAMILGYQLIAKKHTTAFIVTEIMSFAILYVSSHIFIAQYGAEGAVMAHALTYFVYTAVLVIYFRKILF
jgi:PST family polysaccharide transporter